jgi:4-diphosphocytidyl-2-C-methyl-D-erythritol kinase
MIVFPIAKINLGLHITAKRSDGYHNIESIFYPVLLCDALELVVADKQEGVDYLACTGINTGSDPESNLVTKAARKLRERYFFPYLNIHLHKTIPIGAGLGGGSSDSACLLRAINRIFHLDIPKEELKEISLEIGSDCPFFIDGVPAMATGRGEKLTHVNPVLSGYYLTLLNPGVAISTKEAYQNCSPRKPDSPLEQLISRPVTKWKELIKNDFEDFAFSKHPVIAEIKESLYRAGALFSLMSGSGSSVYGIFREKPVLPDMLKSYVIFERKI